MRGYIFQPHDLEFARHRFVLHLRTHVPSVSFECVRRVAIGGPYVVCTDVALAAIEPGSSKYQEIDGELATEAKKYFSFLQQYPVVTRAHVSAELSINGSHIYFTIGWF